MVKLTELFATFGPAAAVHYNLNHPEEKMYSPLTSDFTISDLSPLESWTRVQVIRNSKRKKEGRVLVE